MSEEQLIAPFQYFGGKRDVACEVWARFGKVKQFGEPFCGSAAVLLAAPEPASLEVIGDMNGFICLGPTARILRSDLRWDAAKNIRVGDSLIAFDEHNGEARAGFRAPTRYRRWQTTKVTSAQKTNQPSYRLTFDDGTVVVASSQHMWLCGSAGAGGRGWRWVSTQSMICGKTQASHVLKVAPVIDREESWSAGWMGGLLDGEGHINGQTGWRITLAQNAGSTLNRAREWFDEHGFLTSEQTGKKCVALSVLGGMRESFRLLMMVRPERLIENMRAKLPKSSLYGRDHHAVRLVAKEYIGVTEVVAIETESHTFVAEGLASHNCNFWRAVANQPGEVAKSADYPVSHIDLGARHVWLMAQRERLGAELQDPNWPGDAKVAGWWLWGQVSWIGSGWCDWEKSAPKTAEVDVSSAGQGIQAIGQIPHVSNAGRGVQAFGKIPHVSDAGRGVQAFGKIPHVSNAGDFLTSSGRVADVWLRKLCARFERCRIIHGDWTRCLNHHYGGTDTAYFMDPPYDNYEGVYHASPVAQAVAEWCRANAELKIALCGHVGDYEMPGWTEYRWSRKRNTYSGTGTKDAEVIWFSPTCIQPKSTGQSAFSW